VNFDAGYAQDILPTLLKAAITTLEATLGGMVIALVLGLGLAVLLLSRIRPVAWTARAAMEFVRGTPLLIQLFFLFYVLPEIGVSGSALMTGIVGLGVHYATYTAEVYRAGIQNVPRGQWEAAVALNIAPRDTWVRIVLPQAIRPMVPALGNYLVAMFKETPLLATITVLELLGTAQNEAATSYRYFESYTLVGLIFLALSIPAAMLVRRLEGRRERH
jgi:polar amino acid transport system permease protein